MSGIQSILAFSFLRLIERATMNTEKLSIKGRVFLKRIKEQWHEISYSAKSIYLGLDSKTGKPVKTTYR